ncbi:hypothetical protein I79_012187 [Cricetulus griseus]|uniref:Uncharacterized protein n=1 Tax=Cricetulus griseus TaxID=10029 RepID=G3HN55_CRIGR|nr:hypothetical protein I79_012187 [Cricetulus griseus]
MLYIVSMQIVGISSKLNSLSLGLSCSVVQNSPINEATTFSIFNGISPKLVQNEERYN